MTETTNELELAIWYDANEHSDIINLCSKSVIDVLDTVCTKNNTHHDDVSFEILKPGDDRVPPVPLWLEITYGVIPRLLVATTRVVSNVQQVPVGIIGDLDKKDVARLRVITCREHQKAYPNDAPLTDEECDQIIDKLGLEVVMDQLRSSVVH